MRGQQFLNAEREVERHSAELKKELRLFDLVWLLILNIMGLSWVGTAARVGPGHIMFWIPAALLFYVPSGIVVTHLMREMPLEGGIYQWAKLRFNPRTGFLVAWNTWLYQVLILSRIGLITADNLGYALGAKGAGLSTNKALIVAVSILAIAGIMWVSWRGLVLGKWINNIGGFGILALFAGMIFAAIPRWAHGTASTAPVALVLPAFSLLNLNLLAKMGFGALSGLDGTVIFAGELRGRNVVRTLRSAMWLAAPLIMGLFIAGTASVLAWHRPDAVDLVSPITQQLASGAAPLVALAAALLVMAALAGGSLGFNMAIRFPMVAGWDHLLPEWFSRLHPRNKTPSGSVLALGVMTFLFALAANFGAGNQEAFQLLDNLAMVVFGLTYIVMFAIPLIASGERAPLGVRLAALSGGFMTILDVVLSAFPIIDVKQPWLFTLKIVAVVLGLQLFAVAYFRNASRRYAESGSGYTESASTE